MIPSSQLSTTESEEESSLSLIAEMYQSNSEPLQIEKVTVSCRPLHAFFEELGVQVVDYLSLDAEGAELRILMGIDWEHGPRIHVISVETQSAVFGISKERQIHAFLLSRNYMFLTRLGDDDLFYYVGGVGQTPLATPLHTLSDSAMHQSFTWSHLADMLNTMIVQAEVSQDWIQIAHSIANSDVAERVCPLGALTARFVSAFLNDVVSFNDEVGFLESSLASEVSTHRILYTASQQERLKSAMLPSALEIEVQGRVILQRLPIPRIVLGDFSFYLAMRSRWRIFDWIDIVSRHVRQVAPHARNYQFFRDIPNCVAVLELHEKLQDLATRSDACGLFTVVRAMLQEAETRLLVGELEGGQSLLRKLELALKDAARTRGLYWLLFFSGGKDQEPTIWYQMGHIQSELNQSP